MTTITWIKGKDDSGTTWTGVDVDGKELVCITKGACFRYQNGARWTVWVDGKSATGAVNVKEAKREVETYYRQKDERILAILDRYAE